MQVHSVALERVFRDFLPVHHVAARGVHDVLLRMRAPIKARVERMIESILALRHRARAQRKVLGVLFFRERDNAAVVPVVEKIRRREEAPGMETIDNRLVADILEVEDAELLAIIERHRIADVAVASVWEQHRIRIRRRTGRCPREARRGQYSCQELFLFHIKPSFRKAVLD